MTMIQRLQNSPLTSWLFRYWRHVDSGQVVILWWWQHPGLLWEEL